MYRCHTHFYFVGSHSRIFEIIREMPPLEHFIHEFAESDRPEADLAAGADVILANLKGLDAGESAGVLAAEMGEEAELILLADKEQIPCLAEWLPRVKDIWTLPMAEEEVRFRFLRWQQTWKTGKDYWQASHFLQSTIDHSPNLVWYKDKDGVHEKVNNSFCQTVNKTRQQVEGQRHAYILFVFEYFRE